MRHKKENARRYYKRHREVIKANAREYYYSHKLECNERTNRYWDAHKDELNATRRLARSIKRLSVPTHL